MISNHANNQITNEQSEASGITSTFVTPTYSQMMRTMIAMIAVVGKNKEEQIEKL
jgi:hypothetical protein